MKRFRFVFDKLVLLAKLERVYSPPISVIDTEFAHESNFVWNTEPLCSLSFFSLVWKDKRIEIVPSNEPLHEGDIDACFVKTNACRRAEWREQRVFVVVCLG